MSVKMRQRLVVGGFATALFLSLLYFSDYLFIRLTTVFLGSALFLTALKEFYTMAVAKGYRPYSNLGIACGAFYLAAVTLSLFWLHTATLPLVVAVLSMLFFFLFAFQDSSNPLVNIAITLFGITYIILPLSCIFEIAFFSVETGPIWVLYLFGVTKLTDTSAYFVGQIFGKNKLAPYISPNKTVEGLTGAILTGVMVSLLFVYYSPTIAARMDYIGALFFGLSLSILAQVGDLCESLLKRDAGVKDSSTLPGLGGALDLVDSMIFTAPLLYIFIYI